MLFIHKHNYNNFDIKSINSMIFNKDLYMNKDIIYILSKTDETTIIIIIIKVFQYFYIK